MEKLKKDKVFVGDMAMDLAIEILKLAKDLPQNLNDLTDKAQEGAIDLAIHLSGLYYGGSLNGTFYLEGAYNAAKKVEVILQTFTDMGVVNITKARELLDLLEGIQKITWTLLFRKRPFEEKRDHFRDRKAV